MPNYDWRAWDDEPWQVRYPAEAIGAETWVSIFSAEPDRDEMRTWIEAAQGLQGATPPERRRVFISHRRADTMLAKQAARAARQAGCEYWLDVEDPTLAWLTRNTALEPTTHSAAIASSIEMALLNCTHVLAIITPHTAGSMWVPYEYGRVTNASVAGGRAACWTHVHPADTTLFAEYLHLGVVARTLHEVKAWLAA